MHPNQITQWRGQLVQGPTSVFGGEARVEATEPAIDIKTLHAKIGELTLMNDFCPGRLGAKATQDAGHSAKVERDCCRAHNDD